MHRYLLAVSFIALMSTGSTSTYAQDFGADSDGFPYCSAGYSGDVSYDNTGRSYGWEDTDGDGNPQSCVVNETPQHQYGYAENGTPFCAPDYDGGSVSAEDGNDYGYQDTNFDGQANSCVIQASSGHQYGYADNGIPQCSPTYSGDTVNSGGYNYGYEDTDFDGEANSCVVDEAGNETSDTLPPIGQCINLGGDLESERNVNYGYTITTNDLDALVAEGFDTVRIPVRWSDWTSGSPDYTIEPGFFQRVDEAVDAALDRNLSVILNIHHFDAFNSDPNGMEAKLFEMWNQIAAHYAGYEDALIFELLNEPHFENVGGQDQDYTQSTGIARMNRVNRDLLAQIRQTHPNRWIIVGSSQYGTIGPMVDGVSGVRFDPPAGDDKLITTAHYYEPIDFTHQLPLFGQPRPAYGPWGSQADLDAVYSDFTDIAAWQSGEGRGLPVLIGEFGTTEATPANDRALYAQTVRQASEDNGFNWCYWDLGSPTFGSFNPDTNQWLDGINYALIP